MRAAALVLAWCFASFAGAQDIQVQRQPIVYDEDGRRELYELHDAAVRTRIAESVVALVPKTALAEDGTLAKGAPTVAEQTGMCASEPFARQRVAAVCTGVLVDHDLVLTAGHCMRLLPLDQLKVVFGYYFDAADTLAVRAPYDVLDIAEIVDEVLDASSTQGPVLDYAFIRLAHDAPKGRAPAPVRMRPAVVGEALIAAGTSLGMPLKVDEGARVTATRSAHQDYFVSDTDTSAGASGGPAFTADLTLLGVLARGAQDFEASERDCNLEAHRTAADASEQFTSAATALASLCLRVPDASSLCRAECGEPCIAERAASASGCAVLSPGARSRGLAWMLFVPLLFAVWGRRVSGARRRAA
jgi:hypothetical protein